uniref:Sodium/calcium exchanger 1-like n=1 Tax=Seriola lalandi dorsalis TaxID=1841481 RepID=A0A3B4X430_SERLL
MTGLVAWFDFLLLITGDGDEEGQEQRMPNCFDYFMHILCIFWKILFACVPPTEYWNGWACFIVSISVIGFLTAIIGDLASHFGCTVGLRDAVTAVVFVALGTSLPAMQLMCFWVLAWPGLWLLYIGKSKVRSSVWTLARWPSPSHSSPFLPSSVWEC